MLNMRKKRWALAIIGTAALAGLGFGATAQADTIISPWSGANGSSWTDASNWGANGVPSSTVGAQFNSAFTNQPTLSANQTTLGIWMADGVGQDVTIDAANPVNLTFASNATLNGQAADILMDDSGNHNLTFGANITLKPSRSYIRVNNAGTLTIAGTLPNQNGAGVSLVGNGAGTIDVTGHLTAGGGTGFKVGNVTLILEQANPTMDSSGFTVSDAGAVVRLKDAGAIASGSNANLNNGTLQLRGDTDTTYSGKFSFSDGTVNADQISSGVTGKTLTLSQAIVNNGRTLTVTGGHGYNVGIDQLLIGNGYSSNITINPIEANLTVGSIAPTPTAHNGLQMLHLTGSDTDNVVTGAISENTAPVQLYKEGNNTWTLEGDNTYSKATLVTGGTLIINGNQSAATGDVTVSKGATLGGSGIIGGNTTIAHDGNLAPGTSPGTLTFNQDLTLTGGNGADGAHVVFEGGDLIAVSGALTLNTGWHLALTDGFQDGGEVTLFQYGSAGATLSLTPTIDLSGLGFTPSGSLTLTDTGSAIVLNGVSAVPEPASLALLGLGGLAMLKRRRKSQC